MPASLPKYQESPAATSVGPLCIDVHRADLCRFVPHRSSCHGQLPQTASMTSVGDKCCKSVLASQCATRINSSILILINQNQYESIRYTLSILIIGFAFTRDVVDMVHVGFNWMSKHSNMLQGSDFLEAPRPVGAVQMMNLATVGLRNRQLSAAIGPSPTQTYFNTALAASPLIFSDNK